MSEYSESYHLKAGSTEDGIDLLRRAGLRGFVLPASNGWVTVLPEGEPFVPDEALIAANTGTLLYYASAEDHGWWFALYVRNTPMASYSCTWEESIQIHQPLDIAALEQTLGPVLSTLGDEQTRKMLNPTDMDVVSEQSPPHIFAKAVGLSNYRWLSFHYLMTDKERGENNVEGAVFVE